MNFGLPAMTLARAPKSTCEGARLALGTVAMKLAQRHWQNLKLELSECAFGDAEFFKCLNFGEEVEGV
jgi:hypothetical protein